MSEFPNIFPLRFYYWIKVWEGSKSLTFWPVGRGGSNHSKWPGEVSWLSGAEIFWALICFVLVLIFLFSSLDRVAFSKTFEEREHSNFTGEPEKRRREIFKVSNGLHRSRSSLVLILGTCITHMFVPNAHSLFFLVSWGRYCICMSCALKCTTYVLFLILSGTW